MHTSPLPMSKRFRPDSQVRDLPLSTQVLVLGKDHIVSFAGTSQFTAQGVSACGLAAFNFARIGFRIEESLRNLTDVLNELNTREVVEPICAGWSSNLHLEVEEIYNLPIFTRSLKHTFTEYGRPRPKYFQHLLGNMKKIEKSAVMIITRPPEIIACFKFVNPNADPHSSTPANPLFVVFDSHPRPSHPHGAGLSFSTSIENTARTLSDILPTMDESLFDPSDFQWQAQLLANCSADIYVANHRRKDHEEAVVQSSLAILTLRGQISDLKRVNNELGSDNKQLESEVDRLRASMRQEQMRSKHEVSSSQSAFSDQGLWRPFGWVSQAIAGPSRISSANVSSVQRSGAYSRSNNIPSTAPVKRIDSARSSTTPNAGAQSIFANNPPPVPSKAPPAYDDFDNNSTTDDIWIQTALVARDLQNAFDSEDRRIRQEHAELAARYMQVTFQCSICMDELPEDDVAKVDDCMHMMCRSCLKQFVSSKIQEHRYPIFCPMCTIIKDRQIQPGVISRLLIEQLGVSEQESQILTEMELAEFTVQIHCRKCRRPAFVDREDYSEAFNIVCPQSDCHHVWCKKCEQTVVADGPKHSCDGSSELDHLMKEKGWKHCPNVALRGLTNH
ncbi:hypothetical protein J3R82DRAFT_1181 [Butyriboletus roseoflavus]|nr:hypothetical protein J3R82DRAFT_1181 [Butyriboletus roseoflavus]